MATCKNCLHYEVCDYVSFIGKTCKSFKNKTEYVKRERREWIEYQVPHIICCSVCDWGTDPNDKSQFHFCPNCGADMRGDTK